MFRGDELLESYGEWIVLEVYEWIFAFVWELLGDKKIM